MHKARPDSIKHILAVTSCKGGVGKSSMALNLAFALSKQLNKSVGLLDADLYGPSVPFLLSRSNATTFYSDPVNKRIAPVVVEGVKTMSMGFTNNDQKAIIRGPIASQIVREFYYNTEWGELDFLIIDMPPGTHDVHLTLAQEMEIDAAVVVTTPQNLSYVDVVKGIDSMDALGVPSIAVIENMSFFKCGECEEVHRIFGTSKINAFRKQFGIEECFEVGMYEEVAKINDQGLPFSLILPEQHEINQNMKSIAQGVLKEIERLKLNRTLFEYKKEEDLKMLRVREVHEHSGEVIRELKLFYSDLRKSCRCALCEDEITGQQILDKSKGKYIGCLIDSG
jgi:Mrp family chromosome partitioning ATPase